MLRLLAETADAGRLMVVATWRARAAADRPARRGRRDAGPAARAAAGADRAHRRRGRRDRHLGRRDDPDADARPTPCGRRTDGNPFFLVEYARLAREGGDLAALLAEEHPPAAVQRRADPAARRPARDATAGRCGVACVVGRQFDVPTLAAPSASTRTTCSTDLDPALAAGLVREFGVDRFRFAHALVRDTAYAGLSRSRRARMHARAAEVLAGAAGARERGRPALAGRRPAARRAGVARGRRRGRGGAPGLRVRRGGEPAPRRADGPRARTRPRRDEDVLRGAPRPRRAASCSPTTWSTCARPCDALCRWPALDDGTDRELEAVGLLTTKALWQTGSYGEIDDVVVGDHPPAAGPAAARATARPAAGR